VFVATDALPEAHEGARTITSVTLVPANDPPLLVLAAPAVDFATAFVEGGGPVLLTPNATGRATPPVRITDNDDEALLLCRITLLNALNGAAEALSFDALDTAITLSGPVANSSSGSAEWVLQGPGTHAQFERVLATLAYENTDHNPDTEMRTLLVEVGRPDASFLCMSRS